MSHTTKLYKRVIKHRLRHEITIYEKLFGLYARTVYHGSYYLRHLMEKYRKACKYFIWCSFILRKHVIEFLERLCDWF